MPVAPRCGNGKCENQESDSCPQDCGNGGGGGGTAGGGDENPRNKNCGNGVCNSPQENSASCPADCSQTTCGNGKCEPWGREDRFSCARDCMPRPSSSSASSKRTCPMLMCQSPPWNKKCKYIGPKVGTDGCLGCGTYSCESASSSSKSNAEDDDTRDGDCGDHICTPEIDENMETCPIDCKRGGGDEPTGNFQCPDGTVCVTGGKACCPINDGRSSCIAIPYPNRCTSGGDPNPPPPKKCNRLITCPCLSPPSGKTCTTVPGLMGSDGCPGCATLDCSVPAYPTRPSEPQIMY